MSGFRPLPVRHVCVEPTGVTSQCSQLLYLEAASMNRQVLPHIGWEIEIRSQHRWEFPISSEKTHVMHDIGIDYRCGNPQSARSML